ncbi:hypothetical protein F2P81_004292 [Scophthalmus maximus]|uniref:Uncharacterized protein n=1 Tax=Scophthalmus maximus TaxID=52904 RepID=A0A6A4TCL9_SCOMX|nr:hypothetical protein F2P81_004292 [Scophthalmus maximus]
MLNIDLRRREKCQNLIVISAVSACFLFAKSPARTGLERRCGTSECLTWECARLTGNKESPKAFSVSTQLFIASMQTGTGRKPSEALFTSPWVILHKPMVRSTVIASTTPQRERSVSGESCSCESAQRDPGCYFNAGRRNQHRALGLLLLLHCFVLV